MWHLWKYSLPFGDILRSEVAGCAHIKLLVYTTNWLPNKLYQCILPPTLYERFDFSTSLIHIHLVYFVFSGGLYWYLTVLSICMYLCMYVHMHLFLKRGKSCNMDLTVESTHRVQTYQDLELGYNRAIRINEVERQDNRNNGNEIFKDGDTVKGRILGRRW